MRSGRPRNWRFDRPLLVAKGVSCNSEPRSVTGVPRGVERSKLDVWKESRRREGCPPNQFGHAQQAFALFLLGPSGNPQCTRGRKAFDSVAHDAAQDAGGQRCEAYCLARECAGDGALALRGTSGAENDLRARWNPHGGAVRVPPYPASHKPQLTEPPRTCRGRRPASCASPRGVPSARLLRLRRRSAGCPSAVRAVRSTGG